MSGAVAGELDDLVLVDEAPVGVEMVDDLQAVAGLLAQVPERRVEDHAAGVTIGVEEPGPVGRVAEDRLEDREDRRDPAAPGEGHDVAGVRPPAEHAGREGGLHRGAGSQPVQHPIGDDPVGHPLDRDLQLVVDGRRRRHRVAAEVRRAVDVATEGQELAGLVVVAVPQLGRNVEHQRAGVVRLGNHRPNPQRVEPMVVAGPLGGVGRR